MKARKTKVDEGIVPSLDLDLWAGDGCEEDQDGSRRGDAFDLLVPGKTPALKTRSGKSLPVPVK